MSDERTPRFLREPWITFWLVIMAALAGYGLVALASDLWEGIR